MRSLFLLQFSHKKDWSKIALRIHRENLSSASFYLYNLGIDLLSRGELQ